MCVYNALSPFSTAFFSFTVKTWKKTKNRFFPEKYNLHLLAGDRGVMELLEEDLTCPICCSLFDDPRVLPCSHNFCKKCLEGLLEGNVRNSVWRPSPFKCPTCRKETSATGVHSLQVNYSLKGIVEKYNKIKISPKMPVCKGHAGQPLNIFCVTDMQLICGICATRGDHTKHVFSSIEDAYIQERVAFESLFQSFETWRRADALSRLDTLETNKRKSLQLLTKESDKVKEFFEKLQHTLDQKKNEILSDFETMKLAVMQAYDPEINKLTTILQEQRVAFNMAEAFKGVSEPIIFLQQMQEFREKIKVIKETPLPPSTLPTSPLMKNFDTREWENVRLVDVDKLSLPQDAGALTGRPAWRPCLLLMALALLALLAVFSAPVLPEWSPLDELAAWKDCLSSFSSYLTKSAAFVEQSVFYWEQMTHGFFVFSEGIKNVSLVALNYVAEFVCKYKLL
ncbi:E3 ubiquitin-protein ligase TRIM13 [Acomys russatus]|uniref:E3 ubiquitin-protein ligase TRIM13 n=1 Tax=Acomys russatus TaxID=60746 RepID=UPI0021E228BA|nr:E3 ubiquitin-protein ligase TRIM13 [Acomys russatus]